MFAGDSSVERAHTHPQMSHPISVDKEKPLQRKVQFMCIDVCQLLHVEDGLQDVYVATCTCIICFPRFLFSYSAVNITIDILDYVTFLLSMVLHACSSVAHMYV